MLFPIELDDETLYSLISRMAILNGRTPRTLNLFNSDLYVTRAADRKLNLAELASVTKGNYGTQDELRSKFRSKYASSDDDQNLIGISNKHRNIWRWCESCAENEINTIGVAYWHQLHQLPCYVACDKHLAPLMEINLLYRDRQSKFILPMHARKLDFYPACKIEYLNTAIAISKIEKELIATEYEFDSDLLDGMFDVRPLNDTWSRILNHSVSTISNGSKLYESHIGHLLKSKKPPKEYLALLIYSAFGSFELFKNRYLWNQAMCNGISAFKSSRVFESKDTHRKVCYDYLNSQEEKSRTGFWKYNSKSARWLSRYDAEWIDSKLPLKSPGRSSPILQQLKFWL